MPRPAKPDEFSQINFIVNYRLLGCTPPTFIFVETAQEPAKELAFFLLGPDLQDIASEALDPRKGRRRKPGRHGRKSRRRPGLPDPYGLIGQKMNARANIGAAIRLTPLRYLFPIYNVYEGVMFSAALLEGLTNIGYEGILGIVEVDDNECSDLDRFRRVDDRVTIESSLGPAIASVRVDELVNNKGFMQTNRNCSNVSQPFTVVFSATVEPTMENDDWNVSVALGTDANTKREQSRVVYRPDIDAVTLDVAADFEAGENCVWGLGTRKGFWRVTDSYVFAYSRAGWPWEM